MSNSIEGGELIKLVEIDQDFCENRYGVVTDNQLNYSEDLDDEDYWTPVFSAVIPDAVAAPPGYAGRFADRLSDFNADNASTQHKLTQPTKIVAGVQYHFSAFFKEDTRNFGYIRVPPNSGFGASSVHRGVNLTSGTISGANPVDSVTATDVGSGWWLLKFALTAVDTVQGVYEIGIGQDASITYDGTNGRGAYVFGANLNMDSFKTYVQTTLASKCVAALGTTGEHKCFNTRVSCQDPENYSLGSLTLNVCDSKTPLPRDKYYFPSLVSIDTNPSSLNSSSRREKSALGVRASMTMTAQDHPHTDRYLDPYAEERLSGAAQNDGIGYDPYERSTMWAKWRVRNPYYFGRPARTIMGVSTLPDLSNLVTRNYVIEKVTGPDSNGKFQITAKDPLKLLDDERAQAPTQSLGELLADIDAVTTSATLAPAGIGNLKYAASGTVAIGKEVIDFTRSGDTLTFPDRGMYGSIASEHSNGDTVQECLVISSLNVSDIVHFLITTYSGLNPAYLPKADWDAEIDTYIPGLYSTIITKPTGLKTLIGELEEEAGFSVWWDDITQTIPMAAVKQPSAYALTISDADIIGGSLKIEDMPDARISQVWTAFGVLNPAEGLGDENNYRSTAVSIDTLAGSEQQYAQEAVVRIYSRWIGQLNKGAAVALNDRLLSRFRDPPKLISFDLNVKYGDLIKIGGSHRINSRKLPTLTGENANTPIRILSAEPVGDSIKYRTEEIKFFSPPNLLVRDLYIDISGARDYNLREQHDQYNSPPTGVETVNLYIESGAIVGSADLNALGSLVIGDWPAGTVINVEFLSGATMIGAGGFGGYGGYAFFGATAGGPGAQGGTALYTRRPINLKLNSDKIQGGGGGGGGGGKGTNSAGDPNNGGGGGNGAGDVGNLKHTNPNNTRYGADSTPTSGGVGATGQVFGGSYGGDGGTGGAPDTAGAAGLAGTASAGGAGGAAGVAIDGVSYITLDPTGTHTNISSITGTKIN